MERRRAFGSLFSLLLLAFFVPSALFAQSARPGMRLTVTRVAPMGGFTANAFLVAHTTTITRTAAPTCGARAMRIEAIATAGSGRVRRAHIVAIARVDEATVEIGTGACSAHVDVTLDDASIVTPQTGRLRARLVGANGLDATLESTAIDGAGVATTVSGHILLSSSP